MLEEKSALVAIWLGLLISACLLPFGLSWRSAQSVKPGPLPSSILGAILLLVAVGLLAARGLPGWTSPLVLSLALILPLLGAGVGAVFGGLAALPLLASTTWWAPDMRLGVGRSLTFVALGIAVVALPRLSTGRVGMPASPALGLLLVLGLATSLLTGPFAVPFGFWALWHHWGVYVAPVEALLAGGVPFRDFPVQYGMGPMLLIGGLCGDDCWPGAYLAASAANILYVLAMGANVLLLTRRSPRGTAILCMTAMACAVLLWTGFPPDYLGPLTTPSVAGMRFLPLALILLCIVLSEAHETPWPAAVGLVLWLFSLAWSPEAAVYATIVWWPYQALRTIQHRGIRTLSGIASIVLAWAGVALTANTTGLLLLAAVFRMGFGEWPSVSGFLTYILNPPGILPPDPVGPVWILLATAAVSLVAMTRCGPRDLPTNLAFLLGLLASSSYYLGRSHNNNVLNLLPFAVLALAATLAARPAPMPAGFARLVLAGLVVWPLTFGLQSWTAAMRISEAADFGPHRLLTRMWMATEGAWSLVDAAPAVVPGPRAPMAEAAAALSWLATQEGGTPLVISASMILPRHAPRPGWTGVNNLANFDTLPDPIIEDFIRKGATTYRRPGWLVVDQTQPSRWPSLFETAYNLTVVGRFGGFMIYKAVPR